MNKGYMPLTVAVFLVMGGMLSGFLSLPQNGAVQAKPSLATIGVIPNAQGAEIDNNAALNVQEASFFATADRATVNDAATNLADASYGIREGMVQDEGASLGVSKNRSKVIDYIIQKGDTIPSIALLFSITSQTITAANANVRSGRAKPGEVIKILPISGVLYQTLAGDTLSSIANIFNVSSNSLLQYNPSIDFSSMAPGTVIVIPSNDVAHASLIASTVH